MSETLPLFPLQLVVFPGEDLNLHIFEPRYKQLIQECEQEGTTFGIPAFIDNKVQKVGTEVELLRIEKRYSNGEMDIKTRGVGIFEIKKFYRKFPGKLYAAGDVEPMLMEMNGLTPLNVRIIAKVKELFKLLKIDKDLPTDPASLDIFDIGHHVGFSLDEEYAFLSIPEEQKRQNYMLNHLDRLLPVVREMQNLQERVKMNGHFKNLTPPEF